MHLGLVVYGSLETVSGGYLYDRKLVEHFQRCGDEVEVISMPWRPYGRACLDNLSNALIKRLNQASFQLLLEDELVHPSLFRLNHWLRRRVSYPLVSIVHHLRCCEARPAWQNFLYRQVEQQYLASINGFIFNSNTTRTEVERLVGAGRPSVVAPPGGDNVPGGLSREEVLHRAGAPGPCHLIFIGNLIPRKGLHVLLDALASLASQDWLLTVVGGPELNPSYARAIHHRIAALGLTGRIEMAGTLSREELAARLGEGHLLAVPSSYEGFGIVYLEAMRFGLPVIASAAGGAREIVSHGVNGFLAPPGDTATLSRSLRSLIENRDLLARMSLAALTHAASQPTWEDSAAKVREFLMTLLTGQTEKSGR
ncbi:MAG: glycosyltransferase family 4 protein [Deltaproteobacteria bacterium]|nr:glycosyltransferase family 4 protein [Deltaproteobacteria bacterium]